MIKRETGGKEVDSSISEFSDDTDFVNRRKCGKNYNKLQMGKERGVRSNHNLLYMKFWRMVAMETEIWREGEGDGLNS